MNHDTREPLDPELEALLASARIIDAPAEAKSRVQARLALSLPVLPGDGGGGGNAAAIPPKTAVVQMARWAFAAALTASGLLGFGVALLLRPLASPQERVVYIEKPQAPLPATTLSAMALSSGVAVSELPLVAPVPVATATNATGASSSGADLAKEREVLDIARAALGRGDGSSALAATSSHERKYARGVLREEREAIAIQALILTGRRGDATARADRFRKQFPQSLLLPTVEAAVGSAP